MMVLMCLLTQREISSLIVDHDEAFSVEDDFKVVPRLDHKNCVEI